MGTILVFTEDIVEKSLSVADSPIFLQLFWMFIDPLRWGFQRLHGH
jgi:hypothetical protein